MKDPHLYLEDIVESICFIESYIADVNEERFMSSHLIQDGVTKRLEIIGEAAKHIQAEIKDGHPEIPWRELAGLRDILTHQYFRIDLKRVWRFARNDLPAFKASMMRLLESAQEGALRGSNQ